jgi:hypothetical protein
MQNSYAYISLTLLKATISLTSHAPPNIKAEAARSTPSCTTPSSLRWTFICCDRALSKSEPKYKKPKRRYRLRFMKETGTIYGSAPENNVLKRAFENIPSLASLDSSLTLSITSSGTLRYFIVFPRIYVSFSFQKRSPSYRRRVTLLGVAGKTFCSRYSPGSY